MNKKIIFSLISAGILIVLIVIIFVLWFIFSPEYVYVKIFYDGSDIKVVTEPEDLLSDKDKSSFLTDVSVIIKNNSDNNCEGKINYSNESHEYNLISGSEYGWLLPKNEIVEIIICNENRLIDLTGL